MKTCRQCTKTLPMDAFTAGRAQCKTCRSANARAEYPKTRDRAIANATRWAKANPKRKQELNRASNIRIHGTRSIRPGVHEDYPAMYADFIRDHARATSDEERDCLCADMLDTSAARNITIPTAVEDALADYEERQ